ncbi:MAG: glycosyl hydrolase [Kiritimatiellia bacterium]
MRKGFLSLVFALPAIAAFGAKTVSLRETRQMLVEASNNTRGMRHVAFPIVGEKDYVFDGGGEEYVFENGVFPFLVRGCTNVTLKNFSIRNVHPGLVQFKIADKDERGFSIRLESDVAYRVADGDVDFRRPDGTWNGVRVLSFHSLDRMRIRYVFTDSAKGDKDALAAKFMAVSAKEIKKGLIRFDYRPDAHPKSENCAFDVGETVNFALGASRECVGLFFENCRNVRVENVTISRFVGMGIAAQLCSNMVVCACSTKPYGEDRVTTTADDVMFTNCEGEVLVENCSFRDSQDDGCNVHGNYHRIASVCGNQVRLDVMHVGQRGFFPYRPGDALDVVNTNDCSILCSARAVEFVSRDEEGQWCVVELDRKLSPAVVGMLVENTTQSPNVTLRGNVFDNVPHIRLSGRGRIVIKDNVFRKLTGGILATDLIDYWYEFGRIGEIIVEDNLFDSVRHPFRSGVNRWTYGDARTPKIHGRIVFRRNRFANCDERNVSINGFKTVIRASDSEADLFASPPAANRPAVWWWFDPSASDAAITRDLEGLARVGVAEFHIYGGSATNPAWVKKVKRALAEAGRLGLQAVICIGAAGCGHRDTDLSNAQKDLVFTQARIAGGSKVRVRLPKRGVKETPTDENGVPVKYWDVAVLAVPAGGSPVSVAQVVDVSACMERETDELVWDAPDGVWTIVRVGAVPKKFGWTGCYIDHMSKEAFDAHWKRVMDPLLAVLKGNERAALKGVMCDSWEAGTVSWTKSFAEEFRQRRGYEVVPWLAVKAGVAVGDAEQRLRFERDFDLTIGELIADNHYGYQKEVANRHGLVSIAEAAGPHQRHGDVRQMQGRCDVAMGECWMPCAHRPAETQRFMVRDAANAAHVYGLGETLAEAFTTIGTYWTESPAHLKPCADRAFCDGMTRVCYHGMMLSPSLEDKPGKVRDVGIHYNPQLTWFEQSKAFNDYLARCSWMLSRGRFAADALVYAGDAVGLFVGTKDPREGLGEGYDYDYCPTELLLQAHVEDGEVVLPCGMRYKVIVLSRRNPESRRNLEPGKRTIKTYPFVRHRIGEKALRKLHELVMAGATVIGERPEGLSPTIDALWGTARKADGVRTVGCGRVMEEVGPVRAELSPDFAAVGDGARGIGWIHRILPDEDVYFLANASSEARPLRAVLRSAHPHAELWNAVDGQKTALPSARRNGGVEVELSLAPYGSAFVVLSDRPSRPCDRLSERSLTVGGAWTVSFDRALGGPEKPVVMTELKDWTSFEAAGIRHYSGTATYEIGFDMPDGWTPDRSASIDLGQVHDVAEVQINGWNAGVAWTSPYRLACKGALKAKGNRLVVKVTNLWPNRLMLDAGLPSSERITSTNHNPWKPTDSPLPSGLKGPVRILWQERS